MKGWCRYSVLGPFTFVRSTEYQEHGGLFKMCLLMWFASMQTDQPFQTGFCRQPWFPASGHCCAPSTAPGWRPRQSLRRRRRRGYPESSTVTQRRQKSFLCNHLVMVHTHYNNCEQALSGWLDGNYLSLNYKRADVLTGTASSFISTYVFMAVVWVELQHRRRGITAAIVFRGATFRSSSHWPVGAVVQTWHAHRPQNIRWLCRWHTDGIPSPFMALCKTSASALELKFALAFTVPLPACEEKKQTPKKKQNRQTAWARLLTLTALCASTRSRCAAEKRSMIAH